jgi:hypothetical protein
MQNKREQTEQKRHAYYEHLTGYVIMNCGYSGNSQVQSSKQLKTVYCCMPLDDGRMTETYCGNNIRGGEEELLR